MGAKWKQEIQERAHDLVIGKNIREQCPAGVQSGSRVGSRKEPLRKDI